MALQANLSHLLAVLDYVSYRPSTDVQGTALGIFCLVAARMPGLAGVLAQMGPEGTSQLDWGPSLWGSILRVQGCCVELQHLCSVQASKVLAQMGPEAGALSALAQMMAGLRRLALPLQLHAQPCRHADSLHQCMCLPGWALKECLSWVTQI